MSERREASHRTIRVAIPASISYDLDRFTKTIANLAEAVGCRPCISGADCLFSLHNDWVVDPAGKVNPVQTAGGIGE